MRLFFTILALAVTQPALAEQDLVGGLPPYTEAVLPLGRDLYGVAIGPGGPSEEFGSDALNGGLYRLDRGGAHTLISLSDGEGLKNPTGLVEAAGQIVLVDGNQVISLSPEGQVNWRRDYEEEGAFFYDIEVLDEATLLVSDFGRGAFVSISVETGEMKPYLSEVRINGLARFEVGQNGIYAVSWGADDAWDSAVYRVAGPKGQVRAEQLADGFGNLESIGIVEGSLILGGYRGHRDHPEAKLLGLDDDGKVYALDKGADTQGISDIYYDGGSLWLTFFKDAAYSEVAATHLGIRR